MFTRQPAMKERIQLLGPPKPKSRRLPPYEFHQYARSQQLPFFFESTFKEKDDWDRLERELSRGSGFDIAVIASFGKMVPDRIIDAFPKGMLVMHPSLLPKYRGACPI